MNYWPWKDLSMKPKIENMLTLNRGIGRSVCDSLKWLEAWILHDSTRSETKGIGVSQEVGRDWGAPLFLGEGPLCTQTFPAGPTRPRVSLERDTERGSLSHCLWGPVTVMLVTAHGAYPVKREMRERIGLFMAQQPLSLSLPTSGTFIYFLTHTTSL